MKNDKERILEYFSKKLVREVLSNKQSEIILEERSKRIGGNSSMNFWRNFWRIFPKNILRTFFRNALKNQTESLNRWEKKTSGKIPKNISVFFLSLLANFLALDYFISGPTLYFHSEGSTHILWGFHEWDSISGSRHGNHVVNHHTRTATHFWKCSRKKI